MASDPYVMIAPVKLDAYLNIDPRFVSGTPAQQRAYLSPNYAPNFEGLQLGNNALGESMVAHDIFEDLRQAPYMSAGDRYRTMPDRQGIYLHWSLPRMYRNGIAGSDSAQREGTLQSQKELGGYPKTNPGQDNTSAPVFRPVPSRWVVWRVIRPSGNGKIVVSDGKTAIPIVPRRPPPGGQPSNLYDCFVIESDCVRNISAIALTEDLEVSSTPYIDPSIPVDQQGQVFLGRSSILGKWDGNDNNPPSSPPVSITVSNPSNPYFADYQPQNSSVFSFFDDLTSQLGAPWKYCEASVSYTVLGYHALKSADPLNLDLDLGLAPADRLGACQIIVDPTSSLPTDESNWLKTNTTPSTKKNMRALCCGSMYNVSWLSYPSSSVRDPRFTFPANALQQSFVLSHPLSVGTNPIDALFGWLRSVDDSDSLPKQVRADLLKMQTLILDLNDDVDSQLEAEDLLATNNFIPSPAGIHYHFKAADSAADDTQPAIPSLEQAAALRSLNAAQSKLNALLREQARLQRQLFEQWWIYTADRGKGNSSVQQKLVDRVRAEVSRIKAQLAANDNGTGNGNIPMLMERIENMKANVGLLQEGTKPSFFTQRDPTLFIAGLSSKWPTDWDADLKVRLDPQLNMQPVPSMPSWNPFHTSIFDGKVPQELSSAMAYMCSEGEYAYAGVSPFKTTPEYFPNDDRFAWKQGWFPLFIEWEVEYYHIPFENWQFAPQGPEARVGYGISPTTNIARPEIQGDYRVLSGRCPLLPQAGAILESTLKRVFAKMSPEQQLGPDGKPLSEEERQYLLETARSLDFSSTPMSGFTNQLRTLMEGSHISPLTRDAEGNPVVLSDVLFAGQAVGLTSTDFLQMASQMDLTPFASLVDIPADATEYYPFKPCTHGQFRFTKLNIIDKFGQVVRGVEKYSDSANGIGPTMTPLFPCLGDSYSVEVFDDGSAKTVLPRDDEKCPFVQLPPSINQDARVNVSFVREDTPPRWRNLDEWENPVRGWLIINQANVSVQVFNVDGTFVREFGVATSNPITRPFPADSLRQDLDPLLLALLNKFADPGYLVGFFRTISQTAEEVQANPTTYAESMLSVLGRPLALTTFGISMELADPPLLNQSTVSPADPTVNPPKDLLSYAFSLKVGDKNNVFDGLYGLLTADPDLSKGVQINWNTLYTYHPPDASEPFVPNDPSMPMRTDFTLQPFYADPHSPDYDVQQAKSQKIFAGLIDPFTALNCYTALLPIQQLRLPRWTINNGLSQISAFFKFGPVLIPGDVPAFDATKVIEHDYKLDDPSEPQETGSIPMPSVTLGEWAWLQPYNDPSTGQQTKYNLLGVTAVDEKPGWLIGPYTAVEGYLQQRKPFTNPDKMPS